MIKPITLSLPMLALMNCTAMAEAKCEVKTNPCVDARTGQARICSTTICTNDKGEVVSIDTIVLKGDSGKNIGTSAIKPKLPKAGAVPNAEIKQ